MPLYIGDYLSDTIGLTNSQHGAYLLSMMAYWRKGESLTCSELKAACGKDFTRVALFYTSDGGRWHHKRIDLELENARQRIKAAKEQTQAALNKRREMGQIK